MTVIQGSCSLPARAETPEWIDTSRRRLQAWVEARDYAGYEPYDLLNAPLLKGVWRKHQLLSSTFIQLGRRVGGLTLRRWLRIPPSKNPKGLALALGAYCDLARCGEACASQAAYVKSELVRLRSPGEDEFCWGYDWNYLSIRGSVLPAFSPNAVASAFAGMSLLDHADVFADRESATIAASAARFCVSRLNRPVDDEDEVCFSYTPGDRTLIYNSSVLVAAFLARIGARNGTTEYVGLARRAMNYLARRQGPDGAWAYGAGRWQRWIDNFHTAYNLSALHTYQEATTDRQFEEVARRGYEFYRRTFFRPDGAPGYFADRFYPVDIHSCAQAMLTFCGFAGQVAGAGAQALKVAQWTIRNMQSPEGCFYYQIGRFMTDRTPYMRWGQAWMFRALAHMLKKSSFLETMS